MIEQKQLINLNLLSKKNELLGKHHERWINCAPKPTSFCLVVYLLPELWKNKTTLGVFLTGFACIFVKIMLMNPNKKIIPRITTRRKQKFNRIVLINVGCVDPQIIFGRRLWTVLFMECVLFWFFFLPFPRFSPIRGFIVRKNKHNNKKSRPSSLNLQKRRSGMKKREWTKTLIYNNTASTFCAQKCFGWRHLSLQLYDWALWMVWQCLRKGNKRRDDGDEKNCAIQNGRMATIVEVNRSTLSVITTLLVTLHS